MRERKPFFPLLYPSSIMTLEEGNEILIIPKGEIHFFRHHERKQLKRKRPKRGPLCGLRDLFNYSLASPHVDKTADASFVVSRSVTSFPTVITATAAAGAMEGEGKQSAALFRGPMHSKWR